MFNKIVTIVGNINIEELKEFIVQKETLIEDIDKILEWLSFEIKERNIEFVSGIGKRKTTLQKWTEQLIKYKERQEKYNCSKKILSNRNSYSKTDPDATFMHMKDDHMRNGQLCNFILLEMSLNSLYSFLFLGKGFLFSTLL